MSKVEVDAAFKEYDKNKVRWKEIKLLRRDLFGLSCGEDFAVV